jgi:hypothetical protein
LCVVVGFVIREPVVVPAVVVVVVFVVVVARRCPCDVGTVINRPLSLYLHNVRIVSSFRWLSSLAGVHRSFPRHGEIVTLDFAIHGSGALLVAAGAARVPGSAVTESFEWRISNVTISPWRGNKR